MQSNVELKKGMKVDIVTKQGKLVRGIVDDVGTKSSALYGTVVRLVSGEIGNVKKVVLNGDEISKKDSVEIVKMIEKGENFFVEFKSSALWSANFNDNDIKLSKSFDVHLFKQRASKVIIAKSIAAFLNSGGGSLIIGVKEKKGNSGQVSSQFRSENISPSSITPDHPPLDSLAKSLLFPPDHVNGSFEVIGINDEIKKLKDQNLDGYKRMIIDDVLRSFFPAFLYNHMNDYLWISFVDVDVNGSKKTLCWIKIKKCDNKVFLKVNDKEIFMIRTDTENRALEGEKLVDYCMKRFTR